jgi:hypothetical protein
MRQLFRASGAALLAPGTVACALIVLGFAGGFSKIGSLGQALSGPAAPPAAAASGRASMSGSASSIGKALNTLTAVTVPGAGLGGSHGTVVAGVGGVGPGNSRHGGAGGAGSIGRPAPTSGGAKGGSPRKGRGTGTVTGTGTSPTVVDTLVKPVTSVTSKIPGPVGTAATATLKSLGQTLDHVLPIKAGLGLGQLLNSKPAS